jgi:hypothetical protein
VICRAVSRSGAVFFRLTAELLLFLTQKAFLPVRPTCAAVGLVGPASRREPSRRQAGLKGMEMANRRGTRLSWDAVQGIIVLLISAIEPIAQLINAISRL